MPELLFYQKPVVLHRESHKNLRFEAVTDFGFSSQVNSVPLLGIEFFESSRDLPVLFSKDESGAYFPITLLSLGTEGHDQSDDNGEWVGRYTPAFIRRYPFALTDGKDLCFDSHYSGLNEDHGEPLFDDEGNNTDTLDQIIGFLTEFDAQHLRTREFCEAVTEQELFKPFVLQVMTAAKEALRLDGLFVIDEHKLDALADEDVTAWFRTGYLAWVYAHLHSLGSLKRLTEQHQAENA